MNKKRILIWAATFVILGLLILPLSSATSLVSAQDDGDNLTISNGTYIGSHLVEGIFFMEIDNPYGEEPALLGWEGSLEGPIEFDATFGDLNGEWRSFGTATLEGFFEQIKYDGQQAIDASGDVDGFISRPAFDSARQENPFDNILLEGTATMSTTLNTEIAFLPQTTVSQETMDVNLQITDFIASCNQVNGSWTWKIDQELTKAQLLPEMESNFFVIKNEPDIDLQAEMLEKLKQLQREGTAILLNINSGIIDQDRIIRWLDQANRAMASINKDLECGLALDKSQFLSPITHLTCEMAKAVRRNVPMTMEATNPKMNPAYYAAVSTGCLGSGAFSPDKAAMVQEQIDEAMTDIFNSFDAETKASSAKQFADAAQLTGSKNAQQAVESWLNEQSGGE